MSYKIGQPVWVYYRKSTKGDLAGKRSGKIMGVYDKFVHVYIESTNNTGWNECFLHVDLAIRNYSIEPKGGEKNKGVLKQLRGHQQECETTDSLAASSY